MRRQISSEDDPAIEARFQERQAMLDQCQELIDDCQIRLDTVIGFWQDPEHRPPSEEWDGT